MLMLKIHNFKRIANANLQIDIVNRRLGKFKIINSQTNILLIFAFVV